MVADGDQHFNLEWLTKGYIEIVLQKWMGDKKLRVEKLEVIPAIPKGENYASVMTRVKLSFFREDFSKENVSNEHTASFLIKTRHKANPRIAEIYEPYKVFETEMKMYETVLPHLSELLQEINDDDKLFANTIHVDYENEAIIFEDLAEHDFCCADRLIGMNLAHAKFALKKLAKMHATAAVLNSRSTVNSLKCFSRGIFNRHTRGFGSFFESLIGICADFAGDCPELGLYYKKKLLKLKEHVVEYATRSFDADDNDFNTLNHGDFWINNVMVRYENDPNLIKDLLLIDFQFCTWTSPALDLHYFFNTSLERQLRLDNQDELVQYYHGILYDTLLKLNYSGKKPTLHELCVQMEAKRFYAVTSALVVQAVMINENTEDADIEALLLNDKRALNFRKMLYKNKIVQENAKKLLPLFDRHGLLDVNE